MHFWLIKPQDELVFTTSNVALGCMISCFVYSTPYTLANVMCLNLPHTCQWKLESHCLKRQQFTKRPHLLRFTVILITHLKFIDSSSLWKAKLEKKKPKFTIFFSLKLPNYTFQKYILNDWKHLSRGGRSSGCGGSFRDHINWEGMQNAVHFL